MTFANPLLAAWRAGTPTVGLWCTAPGSLQAEILARQVDYVCLDLQHGMIGSSESGPMIQAVVAGGAIPLARVRWNEPASIMAVLDAGVLGVVVPLINDAEGAALAVDAFRYPPQGHRSYGPVRARSVFASSDPEVLQQAACILMIETIEGIRNVEEIAAVDGVDALYVGPSDLALALGIKPGRAHLDDGFTTAVEQIYRACRRNGVAAGFHAADGAMARMYLARGFDMVTVGSDTAFLSMKVEEEVGIAHDSS
jgi:4-hydroxy-2-oxoheptanedioate aldolase